VENPEDPDLLERRGVRGGNQLDNEPGSGGGQEDVNLLAIATVRGTSNEGTMTRRKDQNPELEATARSADSRRVELGDNAITNLGKGAKSRSDRRRKSIGG